MYFNAVFYLKIVLEIIALSNNQKIIWKVKKYTVAILIDYEYNKRNKNEKKNI